jgi:hypothetical protein
MATHTRAEPSPRDLLERALELSGCSLRAFAEDVLARDERTVRRWRSGDAPIPALALRWLRRYVATHGG